MFDIKQKPRLSNHINIMSVLQRHNHVTLKILSSGNWATNYDGCEEYARICYRNTAII